MDAQTDQDLYCPYMPKQTFSHGVALILFFEKGLNFISRSVGKETITGLPFDRMWHLIRVCHASSSLLHTSTLKVIHVLGTHMCAVVS